MNIHIKTLGSTDRNRFILLAVVFGIIKTFNSHYFFFFTVGILSDARKAFDTVAPKAGTRKTIKVS